MSATRSGFRGRKFGLRFWIFLSCLAPVIAFFLMLTPSFHDKYFGMTKNEATAVGSLELIHELEKSYASQHPDSGFACKLEKLGPTQEMLQDARVPINLQTGKWVGYKFEIEGCSSEKDGGFDHYQVTAVPLRQWTSGVRAFCTDQSGNLFYDSNGSASECLFAHNLVF